MHQVKSQKRSTPGITVSCGLEKVCLVGVNQRLLNALQQGEEGEALDILDKWGDEVHVTFMSKGRHLLCEAIRTGSELIITVLIAKYKRLQKKNLPLYLLALDCAVKTLDIDIVRLVLGMYKNPAGKMIDHYDYIYTIIGESASTIMSNDDSYALVELLMGDKTIAYTVSNKYLSRLLDQAIDYQRADIMQLLLEQRDLLDIGNEKDAGILVKAFKSKSAPIIKTILGNVRWGVRKAQTLVCEYVVNNNDPGVLGLIPERIRFDGQVVNAAINKASKRECSAAVRSQLAALIKTSEINKGIFSVYACPLAVPPSIWDKDDKEFIARIHMRSDRELLAMLDHLLVFNNGDNRGDSDHSNCENDVELNAY